MPLKRSGANGSVTNRFWLSSLCRSPGAIFFFFNDTATTEIYTLSLHDALPIYAQWVLACDGSRSPLRGLLGQESHGRSEEHTSELQSQSNLVCRLLLEKNKQHRADHRHADLHQLALARLHRVQSVDPGRVRARN